jgi:tripartite-type tricarboxylate transporter receptor subunit TctC
MRRVPALLLTVLASAGHAKGPAAHRYPEKAVKIIVPFAPGGIADATARLIAAHLGSSWGKPFIVENRPGGAATIAAAAVAKSPPDGYTLLLASTNVATNASLYKRLPYDADRDLVPVALAVTTPGVLVVHPSVSARSVQELQALDRARPGALNYASVGIGSFPHLAVEALNQFAHTKFVHVPYKGFAPAISAVLSNEVELLVSDASGVLEHIHSGRLRAVAVTGTQRLAVLPDVPTVAESGVSGFEAVGWLGVMAPAGTPPEVVARLNSEINRSLQKADVAKRLSKQGVDLALGRPEDFASFVRRNRAHWAKVVAAARIELE